MDFHTSWNAYKTEEQRESLKRLKWYYLSYYWENSTQDSLAYKRSADQRTPREADPARSNSIHHLTGCESPVLAIFFFFFPRWRDICHESLLRLRDPPGSNCGGCDDHPAEQSPVEPPSAPQQPQRSLFMGTAGESGLQGPQGGAGSGEFPVPERSCGGGGGISRRRNGWSCWRRWAWEGGAWWRQCVAEVGGPCWEGEEKRRGRRPGSVPGSERERGRLNALSSFPSVYNIFW